MNWLNKVLNAGVNDLNPDYLNQKIKITNIICLFYLGQVVFFDISLGYTMPTMFYLMLPAIPISILVILLNSWSQSTMARLLSITSTSSLSYLIHNYMVKAGEPGLIGMHLIQFSLTLMPWIMFDFRERTNLFLSYGISCIFLFLLEPTNSLIEADDNFDPTFMRAEGMQSMSIFSSIFISGVLLFMLQRFNKHAEDKNQLLLEEADIKNQKMLENEEKMNSYVKEVEAAREEEKKREWANKGLALFSEILRSTNGDHQVIYDNIISNIVKYLGANQAALFVIDRSEEGEVIELKACFAYDRKKYLDKKINLGEGLVGQCVLEKDIIYLKDIPNDYVKITSGTGEALPKEILLVPLVLNENVYGVVEIASFKSIEDYQIAFLKKVGETLSASISSIIMNTQTKILLEQSMQQSEELRTQEEEMRQTLEEMNAIQEELAKKQMTMESTIDELKLRNEFLEERERIFAKDLDEARSTIALLKSA